jgi:hypothetical protein
MGSGGSGLGVPGGLKDARVIDAKEVGVGNPAEETFYHPNARIIAKMGQAVKPSLS